MQGDPNTTIHSNSETPSDFPTAQHCEGMQVLCTLCFPSPGSEMSAAGSAASRKWDLTTLGPSTWPGGVDDQKSS